MSDKSSGETILAFLLGGMIGAAIGILFAPASGRETRKKIRDLVEDLESGAEDFIANINEKVHDEKKRIDAALEAGKKAYEKK